MPIRPTIGVRACLLGLVPTRPAMMVEVEVWTSMNLNLNPRLEQFEMTDDSVRAALFGEFVDALFVELVEGDTEDRQMPNLSGLESVQPHLDIAVGVVGDVGKVSVGVMAG